MLTRPLHRSTTVRRSRRLLSSWNNISPFDSLTSSSSLFNGLGFRDDSNNKQQHANANKANGKQEDGPYLNLNIIPGTGNSACESCNSRHGEECAVDRGEPCPVRSLKLAPEVPPGSRTVQVRGTNRRSVIQRALREQSIDVNFDYRSWQKHQQPWRNINVWSPIELYGNSDLRRILYPDVATVGLTAAAITYYNHLCSEQIKKVLDTDGDGEVSMSELRAGIDAGIVEAHYIMGTDFFITNDMITLSTTVPFTLTSMALGMMLTFRTQNCNARYNEARGLWGAMINEGRALSSRLMSLVGNNHEPNTPVSNSAKYMVQCVMTFSRTLKYHVTIDGHCPDLCIRMKMTDDEVNAAKGVALRQELATVWDYNDPAQVAFVDRLLDPQVSSRPLHVLQEMSEITAQMLNKPKELGGAGLEPHHIDSIYRSISRFQDVLGACERIFKTPIYTGATRFTSRTTYLWTNLIPLALYPIMGPVATIPSSLVVALFMYGLEDVGARIEQPFQALPLWQYCDGIDAGCKQILAQHEILKEKQQQQSTAPELR